MHQKDRKENPPKRLDDTVKNLKGRKLESLASEIDQASGVYASSDWLS
jgi:hypothetical protein